MPYRIFESEAMKIYDWKPTESAFKKFPTIILGGKFLLVDGTYAYLPDDRVAEKGWGEVGSVHIVDPEVKALPKSIYVSWFSLLEDKFYEAELKLPLEQLNTLFEEGVIDPVSKKKHEVEFIVVGTSLEGHVSIWLRGAGFCREVMTGVGRESKAEWSAVTPNTEVGRDRYIDIVLEDTLSNEDYGLFSTGKLIGDHWNRYLVKKNLKFSYFGFADASIVHKFSNGELFKSTINSRDEKTSRLSFPIITKINGTYENSKSFRAEIKFDEEELFEAFSAFEKHFAPGLDFVISYTFTPLARTVIVNVTSQGKSIRLKKLSVVVNF